MTIFFISSSIHEYKTSFSMKGKLRVPKIKIKRCGKLIFIYCATEF